MELRQGYKQTAVGVIPEDWKSTSISEIGTVSSGGTPSRKNSTYWNGSIPWITTAQIESNTIQCAEEFISEHGMKNSAAKLFSAGTLIMAMYGQGKTRGKVAVLGIEATTNQACAAIALQETVCRDYVFHFLVSQYENIRKLSNTGNQENLNSFIIKSIPVPLPPLPEQRAIATALSDVDAMIASLDKLIAKKRDMKQAAMQELLTGKRRLPGFSGEWEVKTMRSLGQTYGGLSGKTKADFGHGGAYYIPFMNVMENTVIAPEWLGSVHVASTEFQNQVLKGDIFFNGSSETPEEVGFCSVLTHDIPGLYLNSFCFGFRFKADAKVNGMFFPYWFRSTDGRKAMSVLAQGATRYNLAKSAFMELEILLPSKAEQTAIATILSDMDAEIAELERKRDKTRLLKQGMMQELLTGRIRLV